MVLALLPSVLCFSFKFCLLLNIFCLLGLSCINPGLLIFYVEFVIHSNTAF